MNNLTNRDGSVERSSGIAPILSRKSSNRSLTCDVPPVSEPLLSKAILPISAHVIVSSIGNVRIGMFGMTQQSSDVGSSDACSVASKLKWIPLLLKMVLSRRLLSPFGVAKCLKGWSRNPRK